MTTTATFSHTGNLGDCLAAIPTLKEFYRQTGRKVHYKLIPNVRAHYYDGAVHPTKNNEGQPVMLNEKMIEMIIPLLEAQPCIEKASLWQEGEDIDFHLEHIRESYVGMPNWPIQKWYFYVFPNLACDISLPWLEVPGAEKDLAKNKIVISRSERYHNDRLDYSFLKPLEDDCVFIGTMREYNQFTMANDLNIKKLTINNFLDAAQAIKQSRFHISNQTMLFQISEGLKHPRTVELCSFAQNVNTFGPNGWEHLSQMQLEYNVAFLNGAAAEFIEQKKALQEKGNKETLDAD